MSAGTAPDGPARSTERLGSGGPWEDVYGYSRVVVAGDLAWTAGCTSVVDGELIGEGDAYTQARTALGVALDSLRRAGFDSADVVQCRLFVVDVAAHGDAVGRAHGDALGTVRPAATMVGVAGLVDSRMLVEVELVARHPGGRAP